MTLEGKKSPAEALNVKFNVSLPSVCQCSRQAPKGVVVEAWAAEAHSRWHCSHRENPLIFHIDTI